MLVAHFVKGHGEGTWSAEKDAHTGTEINQSINQYTVNRLINQFLAGI